MIVAETVDVLADALATLSEESEPLGLRVSWVKTKIQKFGDLPGEAIGSSIPVKDENVEAVDSFTYLGSVVYSSASCEADIDRRLCLAHGAMNSLKKTVWRSRYLSMGTKVRVFRSLVLPVLLYGCEAWTLSVGLNNRLDVFQTSSLRRIFGLRWSDFVSNAALLRRSGMRTVSCMIRQRRLRTYGHLARFSEDDPAHQILKARDPAGWVRPVGGVKDTWLRQLKDKDLDGGMGPAQAWTVARKKPQQWGRRVSAAKCRGGACPHDLT